MERFVEFVFSNPTSSLYIALLFFCLGSSIVYLLMKPKNDYIEKLRKENRMLKDQKKQWAVRAMEYEEMVKAFEQRTRG